jgi:hypothetical protein
LLFADSAGVRGADGGRMMATDEISPADTTKLTKSMA